MIKKRKPFLFSLQILKNIARIANAAQKEWAAWIEEKTAGSDGLNEKIPQDRNNVFMIEKKQ